MPSEIVQRSKSWIDILNVAERIEVDSPNAAERFFDAIEESFVFLSRFPEAASIIETNDDRVVGLRLWPMKRFPRHLILYRYHDDRIEILRVIHASQDLAPIIEDF